MKKETVYLLTLLPMSAMAQTVTPESIMAKLPPMPTEQQMVQYGVEEQKDNPSSPVVQFMDELNKVLDEVGTVMEQAHARQRQTAQAAIDADLQKKYGKGVADFQHMTEAEQKAFGKAQANQQLTAMGINRSVEELENMSEDEQMRLADEMASQMTGMSMANLQKMEGMGEEEQVAYIMQGNRMDAIKATAANQQPDMANANQIFALSKEQQQIQQEIRMAKQRISEKYESLRSQSRRIWNIQYQPRITAIHKELMDMGYFDELQSSEVLARIKAKKSHIDGLFKEIKTLEDKYYAETIPLWYNAVKEAMNTHKQFLPKGRRLDAINRKMGELNGSSFEMSLENLYANVVAEDYLNEAKQIDGYEPPMYVQY